ncbi:MAG: biotin/lipoyl-binding protein, partial [Thiothrix sp.]|nr:biotin/lipoyl-binding protein [Thiothrix sp.]
MKTLKIILLLLVGVAVAVGLWFWQQYSSLHPSTEDAYVEAHTVTISPQVSGQVAGVPAYSYQTVQQGDVLLVLDDSNYRIALEQAKARLTLAQSGETHATEAKAQLLVAQLAVERAELDLA